MTCEINGREYEFPEKLEKFSLYQMDSKNVSIWGVRKDTNEVLVQFTSGKVFVYSDVTEDVLSFMSDIEGSVGKAVSSLIVGKFPTMNISNTPLIKEIIKNSALLSCDVFSYKGNVYGFKGDPVKIISDRTPALVVEGANGFRFPCGSDQVTRI